MSVAVYGGIDVGKAGCLAVIRPDGSVAFFDTPTIEVEMSKKSPAGNRRKKNIYDPAEMARLVREAGLEFVTLEKTWAMAKPARPGQPAFTQGVVSMFSLGEGYGLWQGILAALGVPYQTVAPARWKGALMADQPKTKEAAVPVATRLYPAVSGDLRTPRGRILDGRADALLLAHYGRAGLR